jgi:hypothetical protein
VSEGAKDFGASSPILDHGVFGSIFYKVSREQTLNMESTVIFKEFLGL